MARTAVRVTPLLLGAALAIVSLNLRGGVTAVGPVLDDIRATLGLSGTAAGVLTMTPLLCFGAVAPVAPLLVRRRTPETVLLASLAVIAAGVLLRLAPSVAAVFAGTVVLGLAIGVANVLVPAVIKRDFERPGTMMGVYSAMLSVGGGLGAGLSVPLEHGLGDSWRWGLAVWALPAVLSIALWLPSARRAHAAAGGPTGPAVSLWRDHRSWMVSGYMGCQALLFYAFVAWLPDVLKAHGYSDGTAGALLSLMLVLGIPVSLAVPVIAERLYDQRALGAAAGGVWVAGVLGILLAPETATLLWIVLLGIGQGAGIALAMAFFALRSPDGRHAAALSGMAQTVGYLVAALGPLAVGALHDASGGWSAPLTLLAVVGVLMTGFAVAAGARGYVEGTP